MQSALGKPNIRNNKSKHNSQGKVQCSGGHFSTFFGRGRGRAPREGEGACHVKPTLHKRDEHRVDRRQSSWKAIAT